jgi:hypothetical protein
MCFGDALQTTAQNLDSKCGSSCRFFVLADEVAKISGRALPWMKMGVPWFARAVWSNLQEENEFARRE